MNDIESLSYTKWECKYHIVFIPKYRKKALYGALRQQLGEVLKQLAIQRESRIDEGHLMRDHVHMLVSIPPKYSVSQVVGYLKGKSAIHFARTFMGKPSNFAGASVWARVGRDEKQIREYIKKQEQEDQRIDQLTIFNK